jgi:hypothetical protein
MVFPNLKLLGHIFDIIFILFLATINFQYVRNYQLHHVMKVNQYFNIILFNNCHVCKFFNVQ